MSIKFICRCGKHLRARDDMAARRIACPRCGAPVGVPSLQPTHRGAPLGPMSPDEILRARLAFPTSATPATEPAAVASLPANETRRPRDKETRRSGENSPDRPVSFSPCLPVSLSSSLPSGLAGQMAWRGLRYQRWLETRWYHCLLFPCRALRLLLGLAFGLTIFSSLLALALPGLVRDWRGEDSWLLWWRWPCLILPLAVLGYGSGFLDCVFASARAGEVGFVRWPGRNLSLALKSGSRWLICFLAGPIVPAAIGLQYWIRCGDLTLWDRLILLELGLLALSSWLLLLLAVSQRERLRDLSPVRVVQLIQRLGHRLVAWAVLAAVVGLAHAGLAVVGLEKVHHEFALGWLVLFLSWVSGLFFATFLFRWVGLWFYWDHVHGAPTT